MQRFLILPILLLYLSAQAQKTAVRPTASTQKQVSAPRTDTTEYAYPLKGTPRLYSANFGEIRSGHFHSGIDIKTNELTGLPVVASGNGYVSRVVVTPGGFGRALYLVLNNGKTAVYGHLDRYRDDIEKTVRGERYRQRSNSVDLHFKPGQYAVRRGELVAYSGNSGTSFGPHLHYELRDTPTQRYLNIVKQGIITPTDQLPPRIAKIHYVEVDSVQGVCMTAPIESYAAVRSSSGKYRLMRTEPIGTGRKGYFIAEVTDRRNGVENTFGIWRLTAWIDGRIFFEYRMDSFTPAQTRFSDAISYFPLQNNSRNEVVRLARMATAPRSFYPIIEERGIIRTAPDQLRQIRIEVEDDRENVSEIEFSIKGHAEEFRAAAQSGKTLLQPGHTAQVGKSGTFSVEIPAGALLEPVFCSPESHQDLFIMPTMGVVPLTPVCRIFDTLTPLRKAAKVSIRTTASGRMQLRAALARRTPQGTLTYIGGRYANGFVTASTRFLDEVLAVSDTLPPRIQPLFADSADLTKNTTLQLQASDNFSGITFYTLLIDGQWAACDRFPMQNILIHTFDTPATGRFHSVRLSVVDGCGNTQKWVGTFYR